MFSSAMGRVGLHAPSVGSCLAMRHMLPNTSAGGGAEADDATADDATADDVTADAELCYM